MNAPIAESAFPPTRFGSRVRDVLRRRVRSAAAVLEAHALLLSSGLLPLDPDGLALFCEMVGGGDCCDDGTEEGNAQKERKPVFSPDEVTFVGVLCACARAGLLVEGKRYFEQMTELYNLKPMFAHYWCMANLYGALGLLQEAEEVLKSMSEETKALALGGLLGLCRFRGEVELGERIALRLIELEPNNGMYYALLCSVYVAAGSWDEAQKVKAMMKEKQ
uniref:Pentatricopeptide repeat-containing protein n=1 Tax=Ananas comosus var. bracteatus TaxID=296719 RepID=A0A6V7PK57_ANACO|nr:unnamed protein product [Ananas comosus var. bracteatus]